MQPQQPYPPQGYAPQPQYAPAPQAPYNPYAVPAPPQAPPTPGYGGAHPTGYAPAVHAPTPSQSNIVRPRLLDFGRENRLVLIAPLKIERGVPNNLGKPGEVQDRMTADVVIFDGPLFAFGGAPEKGKPHTSTVQSLPYVILSMWLTPGPLISQCERRINEYVCGRLGIKNLPNGNTAYKLDDPTEGDLAIVNAYLAANGGKIVVPQGQAQIPATQPSAGPAPQYAPGGQMQPQQQYMTAPAPLPQYASAQPMQVPPMPQLDIDTPPVGFPGGTEAWLAIPADQRQAWAAAAASRPGV